MKGKGIQEMGKREGWSGERAGYWMKMGGGGGGSLVQQLMIFCVTTL